MKKEKEIETIKAEIGDLTERLRDLGEQSIQATAQEYVEKVKEKSKQVSETAKQMGQKVDTYVSDHPWQVAVGSAVFGMVAGYILGKKRK